MKEYQNIIREYQNFRKDNQRVALATVVSTLGSSYRQVGARMLIAENGQWTGSISGGCLEGDALQQARDVISSQKPKLITYDTRHNISNPLGGGYGCNGILEVLIEPVSFHDENNAIRQLEKLENTTVNSAVATIFKSENPGLIGKKIILSSQQIHQWDSIESDLTDIISGELQRTVKDENSHIKIIDFKNEKIHVLFEFIKPNIQLIICGGVFHVNPLVQMANLLGWKTIITDEMPLNPLDFPGADQVVSTGATQLHQFIDNHQRVAIVSMTHNYIYLIEILQAFLPSEVPYIGILGSRTKVNKVFNELKRKGTNITEKDQQRLFSPVGLDIGTTNPEEIALAIAAEIQTVFSDRTTLKHLKEKQGKIHTKIAVQEK